MLSMFNTVMLLGSKGYIGETFQKYFSKNNKQLTSQTMTEHFMNKA